MKLGIDLGGTKIEIIALDEQGVELLRRRVPTPQGDYSKEISHEDRSGRGDGR
jgi:fructokinase